MFITKFLRGHVVKNHQFIKRGAHTYLAPHEYTMWLSLYGALIVLGFASYQKPPQWRLAGLEVVNMSTPNITRQLHRDYSFQRRDSALLAGLLSDLDNLLDNQATADIHFMIDQEQVTAHKLIVLARCERYRSKKKFSQHADSNSPIVVQLGKHFSAAAVRDVIVYLYTGKVKMPIKLEWFLWLYCTVTEALFCCMKVLKFAPCCTVCLHSLFLGELSLTIAPFLEHSSNSRRKIELSNNLPMV